jgi:hypothetical protein
MVEPGGDDADVATLAGGLGQDARLGDRPSGHPHDLLLALGIVRERPDDFDRRCPRLEAFDHAFHFALPVPICRCRSVAA